MFLKHAYAGTQHIRRISASDFTSVGFADQGKVEWNPGNDHTAEVSDEAGQWLTDNEPGEWEVVDAANVQSRSTSSSGTDDDGSSSADIAKNATGAKRPRSS